MRWILATLTLWMLQPTAQADPYRDFWQWFSSQEAVYFNLDTSQESPERERRLGELSAHLQEVHPELTFEFGPAENGRRDFVLSAGGIRSAFPDVEALAREAPALPHFKVIAFRPRRATLNAAQMGDLLLKPEDVRVRIVPAASGLDLIVYLKGYREEEKTNYGQLAFHLLDQALGERDVETRVGIVTFQALGAEPPPGSLPLTELAPAFDEAVKKAQPQPKKGAP